MNFDVVIANFPYLLWGAYPDGPLGGLALSIVLAAGGIFGAFWIGLVMGLGRLSTRWWVRLPSIVYIEIIRGVPLLLLIFWFYFLGPVAFGHVLPETTSALIAFIVFTGAYVAEIVRAGVLALPRGQMEAARSSGLSHVQAMRYVILPQALRNMIPSFVNQFVSLTKDTSLASIIGVLELTRAADQISNRVLTAPTEIYFTILVLYFIICYVLTATSRRLEKHMSRYQARDR
ncbi:polar amino acid ABC transporter, inner membrane subunit [Alkalidesulfovibrio alkalitolerans DSM 16529]|uniref:Polar amino acid ABC transporter, inner membrane subunit n=1 Tax=Alkalidesulfovibrio alkalitolerans DSM 16529 TaxID=1121439 RepID=S7UBZ6_9BACT|nr:amino acid ABC transporter permease [Alkalidesulfovibrio alkalitolerans]EPR31419.1 polar amino acid ABC transporter, inner membrane subunit [Alkalidesulfovibrio alkalitolerans DSM 16529]